MTFTLLARCSRTGQIGIGIATYSIGVGLYCNGLRGGVGATITQAFVNQGNNPLALRLLEQGFAPQAVLEALQANDPDFAYRQIGIVDRQGRAVAYTGPKTRGHASHLVGDGAFGNGLVGPQVLDGLIAGFITKADDSIEYRLMRALEDGRDAGGQGTADNHKPERSAAIKVVDRLDYPEVDVRVDVHPTAVAELGRVLEEFKKYEVFYRERGRNPSQAIPQDVFVARLNAAEAQKAAQ